jgi:hypothetical protein
VMSDGSHGLRFSYVWPAWLGRHDPPTKLCGGADCEVCVIANAPTPARAPNFVVEHSGRNICNWSSVTVEFTSERDGEAAGSKFGRILIR